MSANGSTESNEGALPPQASAPLHKYVHIDGLLRILGGSIRFTQPGAFNDPFELLPELIAPAVEHPQNLTISFDTMAKRRDPPVGEVPSSEELDSSDVISRDIVKELNRTIGIFCLSKINDLLLMWSHYAEQYAGAVIEFDGSNDFFAGQIEVEYRPLRPRKNISAYLIANQPVPVAELCVKSDQWAYEREVRIVRPLSDCKATTASDPRGFYYANPLNIKRPADPEGLSVADDDVVLFQVQPNGNFLDMAMIAEHHAQHVGIHRMIRTAVKIFNDRMRQVQSFDVRGHLPELRTRSPNAISKPRPHSFGSISSGENFSPAKSENRRWFRLRRSLD